MTNTYTQIVTNIRTYEDETRLQLTLRPSTLDYRDQFRNSIEHQINHSTRHRIPWIEQLEGENVIDNTGIVEINNITSSERRLEFLESVFSSQNSEENRLFLIQNTTNQVRTYLHDLLIRSANNSNITEQDFYRIGNIFLYTISNIEIDGLIFRDIIQNMLESMVIYNTNQVFSILDNQVSDYNNYLDDAHLATETQLEERVQEFNQEVDQRISLNRKRVLYAGVGLLGSMALTSLGMPPIGGLLVRSLSSTVPTISSSNSVSEIIRFRDVWDASLKKMLDFIQK
jgi:hypothetical protein